MTGTSTARQRLAFLVIVGLASGIPNRLVGETLTSWLALEKIDVRTIGLFALVALPYNVKFIWAPLLDRFRLGRLGRRRGWIVVFGLACAAALIGLGSMDPAAAPVRVAMVALMVAFISASLDVCVDAYRTDLLPAAERGPGAAAYVAGYRTAMVATGAGALALSAVLPWSTVYIMFAVLLATAAVLAALAPEPADPGTPPPTLRAAVWQPIAELARRPAAIGLLGFVLLFRIGEGVLATLFPAFLLGDYSRVEVAVLQQGFGMAATVAGAVIGGSLLARIGVVRALLWFGGLSAATNLLYAGMAVSEPSLPVLAAALTIDNVANGLAVAAFVAFLMSHCSTTFTATHYAFLSALSSVAGRLLTPAAATLARDSWPLFFAATAAAGLPALLILRWGRVAAPVR